MAIENRLSGRREINLYDAPRRDLKVVNKTFVSITIFIWYYISYHCYSIKGIRQTIGRNDKTLNKLDSRIRGNDDKSNDAFS